MLNIPLVVHIHVLQQYAAFMKFPFATMRDKIMCQSHYINYTSKFN